MNKFFRQELKEIRKTRGLRLVDLQKTTGITASFISQLERGVCVDISVSYATKLGEALNLPYGFFGERVPPHGA